jgi:hypothetical protein
MSLPFVSDQCEAGKHWLCEDPADCVCPCHEGDEEEAEDEPWSKGIVGFEG